MEIQDYARLPLANELVDGGGLAAEQQLMVPVQINPVCVAARAAGATVGVCLRDNRQLNGWKPGAHVLPTTNDCQGCPNDEPNERVRARVRLSRRYGLVSATIVRNAIRPNR